MLGEATAEFSQANSNDGGHQGLDLKIFRHLTPTERNVSKVFKYLYR